MKELSLNLLRSIDEVGFVRVIFDCGGNPRAKIIRRNGGIFAFIAFQTVEAYEGRGYLKKEQRGAQHIYNVTDAGKTALRDGGLF